MWGYTRAQVELMAHDAPITVYKAREKKKADPNHVPTPEESHEAYRKWLLRKAKRKFNLKKFLAEQKQGQTNKDNNDKKE